MSERIAIEKALEDELGERRGRPSEKVENFPPLEEGKTRDIAAAAAGFGNASSRPGGTPSTSTRSDA